MTQPHGDVVLAAERRLLSIVVPTCNRPQYLRISLNTIIRACPSAEVIVCDNSDSNSLATELAELIEAGRIRYQFHSDKLSVVANFERARQDASGKYLMFIGDDDCVGPCLEDVVRWADANQVDAVVSYRSKFLANYFWPGVKSKYFKDKYAAALFISDFTGRAEKINNRQAIEAAAVNPGSGLGSMPRAYHGIVRRDVIDRIVDKWGALFGGVSPDIYSATLISTEATNAWIVDFPFVLPGGSPPSTAGQGAARIDNGALKATEHIQRFGNGLIWDQRIPAFYSPLTVWSYSMQCALTKIGVGAPKLNYPKLYLSCLVHHPQFREATMHSLKVWRAQHGTWQLTRGVFVGIWSEACFQVMRVSRRLFAPHRSIRPLADISEAFDALSKHALKERPVLLHKSYEP